VNGRAQEQGGASKSPLVAAGRREVATGVAWACVGCVRLANVQSVVCIERGRPRRQQAGHVAAAWLTCMQ
jgi:hypothetical protein